MANIEKLFQDSKSAYDSDKRYMACVDLSKALTADQGAYDEKLKEKIFSLFIKMLNDESEEVQQAATKAISLCVTKISPSQVSELIIQLSQKIYDDERYRDVYSDCLQNIISNANE